MAKGFKILLVVVLAAVVAGGVYYVLNPKKALNILIPEVNDISDIHVQLLGDTAYIDLNLDVTNKGLFKLSIDTLDYHIQFDTNTLLSKRQYINLQLAKGQKDTLLLPLALPVKRLKKSIKDVQGQDSVSIPIELRVVYSTWLGKAVLPYSKTLRIETPHPPKFEVEKIEYMKRKDKTVYLDAHIKMHNYGKIDLDVSGINYTLTVKELLTATGSSSEELHIKPRTNISTVLPIKVEFKNIFKTLKLIVKNDDKVNYHLVIKGFIHNQKLGKEETPVEIEKDGILELRK